MFTHRGKTPHPLLTGLPIIALLTLAACVENPELGFDPYDPTLRPIALTPDPGDEELEDVPRNAVFTLTFNTYLDPRPLQYFNTMTLTSGGVRASGRTQYSVVERAITFRTTRFMLRDLYYDLSVVPEVLLTLSGQPYVGPTSFTYLAGDYTDDYPAPPLTTWVEVEPLLEPCGDCHDDPEWKLEPLTYDAIVGVPSVGRPDRLLVNPYDPHRSYILHKLLWDFPSREGYAQPPAWAGYEQLDEDSLLTIERWIEHGALREPPTVEPDEDK